MAGLKRPFNEEVFAHGETQKCHGCEMYVTWDADIARWWIPYRSGNPEPHTFECKINVPHRVDPSDISMLETETVYKIEAWVGGAWHEMQGLSSGLETRARERALIASDSMQTMIRLSRVTTVTGTKQEILEL